MYEPRTLGVRGYHYVMKELYQSTLDHINIPRPVRGLLSRITGKPAWKFEAVVNRVKTRLGWDPFRNE